MKSNVHGVIWAGIGFIAGGGIGLILGAAICFLVLTGFNSTSQRTRVSLSPPAPMVSPKPTAPAMQAEAADPQSDVGKSFNSINDLFAYFDGKGFVMLGRFDKSRWPANIVSIKDATNEIKIVRKGGPLHHYPGYTGYRLKGVSLEDSGGQETLVVLRSKEKISSE